MVCDGQPEYKPVVSMLWWYFAGIPNPPFTIQGSDLVASENNNLDFERAQSYAFNVTVRDGGSPPQFDQAEVRVYVTDENDNSPQFFPSNRYSESVEEGDYTSNSTVIGYVSQ